MNKQQLASKIWESANKMRSKIEANEYKDYILGFIFYKFLSDKETAYLKKCSWTDNELIEVKEEDTEVVESCQKQLGYFISYDNLFSTWIKKGKDFDVSNVRDALSAFSRLISETHKKVFNKIFDTLQTGLSKLGDSSGSQTKAINGLIQLIRDIPMDGKQDYDVLGFIYEYLISNFAANAGKKAGEFYTPHEVSLLMSEIVANHLKNREKIEIYDPTSGSGSLLINIGRSVSKHIANKNHIKYYAQELKENTYNLTRMNLVMRGILPDNIITRCGDTLETDWPYFEDNDPAKTYEPLYVDAVVSNPPYSQVWDPTNKDVDARYSRFGLAPKSKADYAFLLHDLYHIKPNGIMTIVLPHGVLFRGGEEETIRKNLIEYNNIDAVIGLPANVFFGTGIPTIIMVLKQKRENTDILIVDASKGFAKVGKNNVLRASDIKKIADTVIQRADINKFSRKVSREEIRNNNYNLNIPRYVDSSEKSEFWDIYASMFGGIPNSEIDELKEQWKIFPNLKKELFSFKDAKHSNLIAQDVKNAILNNVDVKTFVNNFEKAFKNFDTYLNNELIKNMKNINIDQEEAILSNEIFTRLKPIPLIDKYKAYQLLDDEWTKISIDLEIIQTEGFNATKKVVPNMVIKKKDGKDEEVQDGWLGYVLPFDLVQNTLLKNNLDSLKQKENELDDILSKYDEIIESFTEEEKEEACLNEGKDAFSSAELKSKVNSLNLDLKKGTKFEEDSLELKLINVSNLMVKEKELKSEIKFENISLTLLTKNTIESLSDDAVINLLQLKWISPIVSSLGNLPNSCINDFVSKIQNLADKYTLTYLDIEKQLKDAENSLSTLIDDLTGDEFDMKGLSELKSLITGGKNGRK